MANVPWWSRLLGTDAFAKSVTDTEKTLGQNADDPRNSMGVIPASALAATPQSSGGIMGALQNNAAGFRNAVTSTEQGLGQNADAPGNAMGPVAAIPSDPTYSTANVARLAGMGAGPEGSGAMGATGIMSLPGGVSPYAVQAPHTDVSDSSQSDPALSPASVPDAANSNMTVAQQTSNASSNAAPHLNKSAASQTDVDNAPPGSLTSSAQDVSASMGNNPGPAPTADQKQAAFNAPFPTSTADWTGSDYWRNLLGGGDQDAYAKARAAELNAKTQMPPPQDPNSKFTNQTGPLPPVGAAPTGQAQSDLPSPVQMAPSATTIDPQAQAIADIQNQKKLIDAIYPQRVDDQSAQNAADAYSDKDGARTNALAQLAFFSGIAKAGGGAWADVGNGLAGAGAAYSTGFDRYQKVLQGKADRLQANNNTKYSDQTARSDAAVKLYSQQQTLAKDAASLNRQSVKDKQDDIDKYFTERLKLAKGTDLTPTDPALVDKTMRDWQLSKSRGEIIQNNDVTDPKDK